MIREHNKPACVLIHAGKGGEGRGRGGNQGAGCYIVILFTSVIRMGGKQILNGRSVG